MSVSPNNAATEPFTAPNANDESEGSLGYKSISTAEALHVLTGKESEDGESDSGLDNMPGHHADAWGALEALCQAESDEEPSNNMPAQRPTHKWAADDFLKYQTPNDYTQN